MYKIKRELLDMLGVLALVALLVALMLPMMAQAQTDTVDIGWKYTPQVVSVYNYDTNGLPSGSVTYTNEPSGFVIRYSKVATTPLGDWVTLTNVSATVTNGTKVLTRTNAVVTADGGIGFFYVLSSNMWGLSPYSSVGWKAGPPSKVENTVLKKVDLPPVPGP